MRNGCPVQSTCNDENLPETCARERPATVPDLACDDGNVAADRAPAEAAAFIRPSPGPVTRGGCTEGDVCRGECLAHQP